MEELSLKNTKEKIYKEVLDNGLKIYLYPNKNSKTFYLSLSTKYGSNYTRFKYKNDKEYKETPNGVAHFLEHITFHLDGKDADELFAPYGAYINAFTNHLKTSYVVEGTNNINECLDNLLYYVYTPYYTEETVQNEKGIIKEESKRGDDDPNRLFWKYRYKTLFSESNFKAKIVGELEEIDSISLEDINNAYSYFYHPSNMYLVISGNFDIKDIMKVINKRMNTFAFDKHQDVIVDIPNEPYEVKESHKEINANILLPKVSISLKMPLKDVNKTGLSLYEYDLYLDLILENNFGITSSYYEEIINNKISTVTSSAFSDLNDDYITIHIINTPSMDKIDDFIKLTEKQLNNLMVSEEELSRKKKSIISDYLLSFDDNVSVTNNIDSDIIYFDDIHTDCIDVIKRLDKDIIDTIIDSIDINNKSILIMKPNSDK